VRHRRGRARAPARPRTTLRALPLRPALDGRRARRDRAPFAGARRRTRPQHSLDTFRPTPCRARLTATAWERGRPARPAATLRRGVAPSLAPACDGGPGGLPQPRAVHPLPRWAQGGHLARAPRAAGRRRGPRAGRNGAGPPRKEPAAVRPARDRERDATLAPVGGAPGGRDARAPRGWRQGGRDARAPRGGGCLVATSSVLVPALWRRVVDRTASPI
jgi:hypothetical protein